MKEVFIISENEEIFLMISNALSYLPVHFSWVGDMDKAEGQFRSEKPDLIFFAVRKLTLLHNWIARFKSFKLKIPFICFVSKIGWEKRELLWMAEAAQVIELPKLKKEFSQIMESILVPQDSADLSDALNGHLSIFSVLDLINTFEEGRKNGVLELNSRNKIGQLFFTKGVLVNATYKNNDALQSIKIMSGWTDGVFRATLDKVPHKNKIELSNQEITHTCQNYLLEREKFLNAIEDKDSDYYSAPLLDYEDLGFLERKNVLFFKTGATINDFFEQEEEGSINVIKEISRWIRNGWLVKKDAYKDQTNILREQEQASGVKKLINKIFSKKPQLIKSTAAAIDGDTFFDEEHDKTEKKPYLFKDNEYLLEFLDVLENNSK